MKLRPLMTLAMAATLICMCIGQTASPSRPASSSAPASRSLPPAMPWDAHSDTWVATDALGRTMPAFEQVGSPRKDKFVGVFYFLWLGPKTSPVYDITQILAANPETPAFGPKNAFHWWGEPLFGYYLSSDEFIIRKHAQMLSNAGVDVMICDVTNALTYTDVYLTICRVLDQMRSEGQSTPQIAFIAHSKSDATILKLYNNFYAKGLYKNLWFYWKGKPLILGDKAQPEGTHDFFTFRESWAWSNPKGWFGNGKDKWCWVDNHPQRFGWHEDPNKPEQISVCVAQHPISTIGRSYHGGKEPPVAQQTPEKGLCFAEQCARALEVNPEFVFITGWNEWVAQRFISDGKSGPTHIAGRKLKADDSFFVDQYTQEFSRDIEPMKAGHGDNYYYQMVDFIRRFKGVRPLPAVTPCPIVLDGKFAKWASVAPEFRDTVGDAVHRDNPGWGGKQYNNATGRNDIVAAKVACDAKYVYFYVRTQEPITPCTDKNWMLLFIDSDSNATTGWLGYDFVVNRSGVKGKTTTIERNLGGYKWGEGVEIPYRVEGCEMELSIPRSVLGVDRKFTASTSQAVRAQIAIDFKWADNIQQTGEASDFTLNGDAAPNDRFNFRAKLP